MLDGILILLKKRACILITRNRGSRTAVPTVFKFGILILLNPGKDRAFDAAESNCVAMGGHLASINSPDEQAGMVFLMGLLPSAAGIHLAALIFDDSRCYDGS